MICIIACWRLKLYPPVYSASLALPAAIAQPAAAAVQADAQHEEPERREAYPAATGEALADARPLPPDGRSAHES